MKKSEFKHIVKEVISEDVKNVQSQPSPTTKKVINLLHQLKNAVDDFVIDREKYL